MENVEESELQEKESRKRNVFLYFVRHGDAEYASRQDAEGYLTPKGKDQAKKAAEVLYKELPSEALVEIISSNRKRAEETALTFKNTLNELTKDTNKNITIHHPQQGVRLDEHLGMSDELTQEALDLRALSDIEGDNQDEVAAWLKNPGQSTEEIENNFRQVLQYFDRISRRISSGRDLYIVAVTHTGPSEVFIGRLLNNIPEGRLANCETFKISLLTNGKTDLSFKDLHQEISV